MAICSKAGFHQYTLIEHYLINTRWVTYQDTNIINWNSVIGVQGELHLNNITYENWFTVILDWTGLRNIILLMTSYDVRCSIHHKHHFIISANLKFKLWTHIWTKSTINITLKCLQFDHTFTTKKSSKANAHIRSVLISREVVINLIFILLVALKNDITVVLCKH